MLTLFTLGIICLVAVVAIPVVLLIIGLPLMLLLGLLPWLLRVAGVVLLIKAILDQPTRWENFLPAGWDAVGYFVSPYDSRTENFSWTGRYGELSPGTYRMVRTYTLEGQDYSVAVEFAVSGS